MKQGLKPWHHLAILFAIILAVFALESNYLKIGFFLDDFEFIELLNKSTIADNFSPYHKYFYRPVFLTWLWTFLHTVGPNPVIMHAGNLVLFGIVIYLLGLLVFRISKSGGLAVLSGLLFWLWPNKTQAVWWISCSSTLLAAIFFISTFICWHGYRTKGGKAYYIGALLCFLLSLGSKEDAHALPLLLLLFDLYVLRAPGMAAKPLTDSEAPLLSAQSGRARWLAYLPFVLGLAAYLYCDITALLHSPFVQSYMLPRRNRFLTALSFTQSLWPFSPLTLGGIEANLWTLGLIAGGVLLCKKSRQCLFLLIWFLLLCLLIGVEASPSTLGSTRFAFLPALPASVLLALALTGVWKARHAAPLLCAALTTAVLVSFNPFQLPTFGGPVGVYSAFVLLAALGFVWRRRCIPAEIALLSGVVLLLAALFYASRYYVGAVPAVQKAFFPFTSMLAGAALMAWRQKALWWQGAVAGLLLWSAPLYSVVYFVGITALLPSIAAQAAALRLRWEAEQAQAQSRKMAVS